MFDQKAYWGRYRTTARGRAAIRRAQRAWDARNPESVRAKVRRHQEAKRRRVDAYKLERGCADCGYRKCAAALTFDHVRGEKRFQVAAKAGHGWERLLAEMEKCEVRCANCHAERHERVRHASAA